MNWIDNFTALIQLISAVNFVYIISHFPTTVLGVIFNKEKLLNGRFSAFTDQINADLQSLETMEPITIQDGRTNQAVIDSLKSDYAALKSEWDAKRAETENVINKAKSVKGSKCLFLYVSLYCILTMFNIAMIKVTQCDFWLVFSMLMNVTAFVCSAYYTYIVWSYKWDTKDNVACYVSTCRAFMLSAAVALAIGGINSIAVSLFGGWPINKAAADVLLSLCVFLPFYPCLMTVVFVHCYEWKVKRLTGDETTELENRQKGLHGRKDALDNMDRMFTRPSFE